MHQAEKYIKQIVEEIGTSEYIREYLKQGRDKAAVADVAEKLKQFSENMSLLQPIAIKGFMVPSGSLVLYHYLKEDLDAVEAALREDIADKVNAQQKTGQTPEGMQSDKDVLPAEQREELQKRVGIVRHRLNEMTESLLSQHIADQIEQRTDEAAAQAAFQENGYLPLYADERTMGIVYNTLSVQLLLDRFNLIFEGVFAPVDQAAINYIMANVLAPYWKQHAQSILFTVENDAG